MPSGYVKAFRQNNKDAEVYVMLFQVQEWQQFPRPTRPAP